MLFFGIFPVSSEFEVRFPLYFRQDSKCELDGAIPTTLLLGPPAPHGQPGKPCKIRPSKETGYFNRPGKYSVEGGWTKRENAAAPSSSRSLGECWVLECQNLSLGSITKFKEPPLRVASSSNILRMYPKRGMRQSQ